MQDLNKQIGILKFLLTFKANNWISSSLMGAQLLYNIFE